MSLKSRGAPFPAGSDPNDVVAWLDQLAQWVNDRPGTSALTTTQRNALTGADLWDGRLVLNTTTDRLNRYDAGTTSWIVIPDTGDIAALLATSGLPAGIADTASRGVSSSAARADHAHAWPTWQSYTPVWSGAVTAGNGARTGAFIQLGKTVHFWSRIVLGTTSSISNGAASSTLPVLGPATNPECLCRFTDAGSNFYFGRATNDGGNANCYIAGSLGAASSISATTPFTWVTTDEIFVSGTYQAS